MGKIRETHSVYKNENGQIVNEKIVDGVKTIISIKETPESIFRTSLLFTDEQKDLLLKLLKHKSAE